mgnify:CR=1 FL=1
MDLCTLYTDKNNGINLYFFSRNPIIFSFQSFYKSSLLVEKIVGELTGIITRVLLKRPHKIDFKGFLKGKGYPE